MSLIQEVREMAGQFLNRWDVEEAAETADQILMALNCSTPLNLKKAKELLEGFAKENQELENQAYEFSEMIPQRNLNSQSTRESYSIYYECIRNASPEVVVRLIKKFYEFNSSNSFMKSLRNQIITWENANVRRFRFPLSPRQLEAGRRMILNSRSFCIHLYAERFPL